MLRDSEEIENVPLYPNLTSSVLDTTSARPPLLPIPVPVPDTTPIKSTKQTGNPPSFLLRTPERHKNRFGFSSFNDPRDEARSEFLPLSTRNHSASMNLTPRPGGRTMTSSTTTTTTNTNSEITSALYTPSKSVSKPPTNPAYLYSGSSRHHLNGSTRSRPHSVVNTLDVPHFDLKDNSSFWLAHNVQVIIRVRPLNGNERSMYGYNRCVKQDSSQCITWIGQPETRFTFDHVACETVDQEMLRMTALPMVENCLSGYNSCIFAYGQTGSGKTYTMLGEMEDVEFAPSPHRGMTPRIFEYLFARIRAEEESRRDEKLKYSCKCSFLEIYNEQITDLLDPSSTNLLLREDVKKGVYVENLSEFEVHSVGDVLGLLIQGSSNRKVAATNMNRESSRSHCVFICIIESKWERNSVFNYRFARLNLVDLAGSERQKSSGAEGERLKEAANINKSLSTLGHVIMLLVDIAQGKPRHIPYRDSRLTFLLQDSLGGNSKTMIIANVSPSISCAAETLNTLKFAQRAKLIQNNAVVNEDSSGDVAVLQHQICLLKEELSTLKSQNVSRTLAFDPSTSNNSQENTEKENVEDLLESESKHDFRVSSKQLKSLEMMLAGALRREQMAETSMKQFEAEIEQLNRLVRQREEDTRCTKMMLKFREDKIQRLESLLGELKPADAYLLEENAALSEEIQMLQSKVVRNPEVTRFAVENIRLLEELRRFQDFYEEGERDLLMNEVSELRAQLIRFHENGVQEHIVSKVAQDAANDGKEHESLKSELANTTTNLVECQTKLKSYMETNSTLSRDIEELHAQLRTRDLELLECRNMLNSVKDLQVLQTPPLASGTVLDEKRNKLGDWVNAEELVNLELELDILKIILKEEKLSHCKMEELTSSLTRDAQRAEQKVLSLSQQLEDAEADLVKAKSVIQELESEQLLSIDEIEDLKIRVSHQVELLSKQELQISALKEQQYRQESTSCLKNSECEDSPLQEQLKRMQTSLNKAKRLNLSYQNDHAYQKSNEEEMDLIRRQAEAETAEVIVCLQEELSALQDRVHESDLRDKEAGSKLLVLETELKELHEDFDRLSHDNRVLCQNLQQKETQIKLLADDWELLSCEIEGALIEGHEALKSASDELDAASTTNRRGWISERVGQMIRQISDKESLIEELNNCLEEANTKTIDMEHMLMSLRGATIVMSESHQQEFSEKEKEILQLRSELHASLSAKKEEHYMSEMNSLESIQAVEVVALSLQETFTDFEQQCQRKILSLNDKLNKVEEHAKEAKCTWHRTKELLEYELVDAKEATAQKAVEASCLLVRFEEVQETMKEADMMINGLMAANETKKLEIEDLRNMNIMLNGEINRLVDEVQMLQSANMLKDQKNNDLENQLLLDASETASIVEDLQGLVSAIRNASDEAVMSLTLDFNCVKSQLQDTLKLMHSSLEEIWSDAVSKDCIYSVLHLCHIGILSDAATLLNSENMKWSQEIEMCRLVKEKLFSDINSSFKCISTKEGETRKLDLKLETFKENLADLQRQEEFMVATCNLMGTKLAVLEEELNRGNLTVSELVVENEKSRENNSKLIESQAEVFALELYAKELENLYMVSEFQLLVETCNFMGSKLTMLQEELNHSNLTVAELVVENKQSQKLNAKLEEELNYGNLTVAELVVENEKSQKHNAKLIESQADIFAVESYGKELEILFMTSEFKLLVETCNFMGSKLTVLEEELNHSNLTVAELVVENEKSQKLNAKLEEELNHGNLTVAELVVENEKSQRDNAKLFESQADVFAIESYGKELEILFMKSEFKLLVETCNFMGSKLTVLEDLNHRNLTVAELVVENEKSQKLNAKLEEELNHGNLTVAELAVENEKSQKHNAKLIESQAEVFALELLANELENSFMASELAQYNLDMDKHKQTCCIALDSLVSEIVTCKIIADLGERLLLEKESELDQLQSTIIKSQDRELRVFNELLALRTFSSKVAKCAYSVEMTELQSCRMLNKLEQNITLVLDQMSVDSSQNMEFVSRFLEELESVDDIAKDIESQNLSLKEMVLRKDEVLNGLLFDLRLLQESAANSNAQHDQIEKMGAILESTEHELAAKSRELDESITFGKEQGEIISATKVDLENATQSLKLVSDENEVLKCRLKDIAGVRSSVERELTEKRSVVDNLENELLEMGNTLGEMNDLVESLKSNLDKVNTEKQYLEKKMLILEGKLETAHALAGENEAITVEAQQIAETRRIYAEEKEEEVQLLERSVQELDSTISVLENKVDVLKGEAERQRLQREELELELHSFKNQMQSVEFADSETKRHLDEKTRNLQEALALIEVLEKDLAQRKKEVAQCRTHISELSLHAEAQACEYQQKFKELEAMLEQFRAEAASNHERNASCNKLEKNPSKARGSASPFKGRGTGSPFKCIGLGLSHQFRSEKDEQMNAERLRIEELEALSASRQKEIFMLNSRLAATESMTHDVIRDLLGVKLHMSDCANQLDKNQVQKLTELPQLDSVESQDHIVMNLKKQLNKFVEERKGLLEEIDRRENELVAAQIALEKLRERELFLSTENNMLKKDLTNQKRQVVELEGEVKKLSGQQNLQQRIHHHAKIKEENNKLKMKNDELCSKMRLADDFMNSCKMRMTLVPPMNAMDDNKQHRRRMPRS